MKYKYVDIKLYFELSLIYEIYTTYGNRKVRHTHRSELIILILNFDEINRKMRNMQFRYLS